MLSQPNQDPQNSRRNAPSNKICCFLIPESYMGPADLPIWSRGARPETENMLLVVGPRYLQFILLLVPQVLHLTTEHERRVFFHQNW